MSHYFPELYDCSGTNVQVELDISNYATKADLNEATGVNTKMPKTKGIFSQSESSGR